MVVQVANFASEEESDSDNNSYSDDAFSLSPVSDLGTFMMPTLQLSHSSIPINGSSRLNGWGSVTPARPTSINYVISM